MRAIGLQESEASHHAESQELSFWGKHAFVNENEGAIRNEAPWYVLPRYRNRGNPFVLFGSSNKTRANANHADSKVRLKPSLDRREALSSVV